MPIISPFSLVRLTGDVVSTVTAFADVTGLSFPVLPNTDYLIEALLIYQAAATTTGINLAVNGPASPVAVVGDWQAYTSASAQLARRFNAYNSGTATTGVLAANTNEYAKLTCLFRNGVNAGTFALRHASEVAASAVTIKAGSVLKWQITNPAITAGITTIDRFFGVVQLCQNLSTMQNNMRQNVQIIQAGVTNPQSALFNNFPAAQQATRDLGAAFLQRLSMNKAIADTYTQDVIAGSQALGIGPGDMQAVYDLLFLWATNLNTAVITNQTQLDNGVAAVLANVPQSMLPF
jgi:hypothetical protein